MLELFLSSLEDQLGLIVNPPLAPIARMGIISEEITRITSGGLTPLAPDGAYLCGKCGLMSRTTKCENCGHIYKRPAGKA